MCVRFGLCGEGQRLFLKPFQKEIKLKKNKMSGSSIEQEVVCLGSSMLQSDPQPCSLCHRLSSLHHVGSVIYLWKEGRERKRAGVSHRPPGHAFAHGSYSSSKQGR